MIDFEAWNTDRIVQEERAQDCEFSFDAPNPASIARESARTEFMSSPNSEGELEISKFMRPALPYEDIVRLYKSNFYLEVIRILSIEALQRRVDVVKSADKALMSERVNDVITKVTDAAHARNTVRGQLTSQVVTRNFHLLSGLSGYAHPVRPNMPLDLVVLETSAREFNALPHTDRQFNVKIK